MFYRLERQKIELEKEMNAKLRSEPDGKRVGYYSRDETYYYNSTQDDASDENGPVTKSCRLY